MLVKLPPMRRIPFLIFLCISVLGHAQMDTLQNDSKTSKWQIKPVSPLKASVFSALIPGGGQLYNGIHANKSILGKYWKVPIVYAGLGTCYAFIQFNKKEYRYYKAQYLASVDDDPTTIAEINASTESIRRVQEQYHQWMDLSYICLAGVYLLQIIEANVDAHLFYFDVSKDLSFHWLPALIPQWGQPAAGLSMGLSPSLKKNKPCKLL